MVTAGIVEDQPSPMHTKEFQTLSVNLDGHEVELQAAGLNIDDIDSPILIQYVDVPTDVHPIVEVSCGTSCCPLCFDVFFGMLLRGGGSDRGLFWAL